MNNQLLQPANNQMEVPRPEKFQNMSKLESVEKSEQSPRALIFEGGICVDAFPPSYPSKILTGFFTNITRHYLGKTPGEISRHARAYAEVMKYWPAPSDMLLGWALTKSSARMDMERFAREAEAAQ